MHCGRSKIAGPWDWQFAHQEAAATRPAGYQNWGGGRLGAGDASDPPAQVSQIQVLSRKKGQLLGLMGFGSSH